MNLADEIRQFVRQEYIVPARQARQRVVTVRAGDVHKAMGLSKRMPAVCGALDTAIFRDEAGVTLVVRQGPRQSSTVEWTFRL